MNSVSRGVRNAFRNVIRTGSIVIILSISIGLIIAMLAARQAVQAKIDTVKSSVGNTISVSPAGVMGFEGGGEALTSDQVNKLSDIAHVSSVTSSLRDRLTTDDTTDLESGIEAGSLGQRRASENSSSSATNSTAEQMPQGAGGFGNPMTSVQVTGVNDTSIASTFGGSSVTWTSGKVFAGTEDTNVAVVGKAIAEKNGLSVGDTFTAYGETIEVVGIYDAGTDFANNGVFMPLASLQRISDQAGSITSATVSVDSIDNLSSTTTAVKSSLGDSADITNAQETVEQLVSPLESVKTISLFSLIGAVIAGAIIILLTMIMIVRERRREIGVMKAIGSSNFSIMKQFVAESVTLTTLALVVGTGIGVAASAPLTNLLVDTSSSSSQQGPGAGGPRGGGVAFGMGRQALENIQSSVGASTLAAGIGATLLIAILGSAIPSLMISKIKPAEAMRSE